MYAMVDREDDLQVGTKSTAIWLATVTGGLSAGCSYCCAYVDSGRIVGGLGWAYYAGLFAAAWFALYQQYLIRNREPGQCFQGVSE